MPNSGTQIIRNSNPDVPGNEVLQNWSDGNLHVTDTTLQKSAFGELETVEPTALVQLTFTSGINSRTSKTRVNNGGTVTEEFRMAKLSSGTNANSRAQLFSRVPVRYGPGQGGSIKFSVIFETTSDDSEQFIGIGDVSDGYGVGFRNRIFGTFRRQGGMPEIRTLAISAGATITTGNITITLNGDDVIIAVVENDTAREVAVKIANTNFEDIGDGWDADVDNNTIIFRSYSAGIKTGSYAFADTDTTGVLSSGFTQTVTGAALNVDKFTAQTDWSEDKADGTGELPNLDFTKGNVPAIKYEWLGFGPILWSMKNSTSNKFTVFHIEQYSNENTIPSTNEPTLPLCMEVRNFSSTTDLIMRVGSMGGFIDGKAALSGFHNAGEVTDVTITTTEAPLISFKNKLVFNGRLNRSSVLPGFVDLSSNATKDVIFRLRINATLEGPVAFTDIDAATSVLSVDTGATGITTGTGVKIETLIFGKIHSDHIDVHILNGKVLPGDIITITGQLGSAGGASTGSASMTLAEQV